MIINAEIHFHQTWFFFFPSVSLEFPPSKTSWNLPAAGQDISHLWDGSCSQLMALDCPGSLSRLSFWGFSTFSGAPAPCWGWVHSVCSQRGWGWDWHYWISVSFGFPLCLGLDFCSPSSCLVRYKGNWTQHFSSGWVLLKSFLAEPKSGLLTFWQNLFSGWKISFLIRFCVVFLFDSKSLSWSSLKH